MEERLLTRFKWGLLAELEKPNKELRYDILRSKIRREGLKIPKEVIDLISENINDSVRELEGVVNSLMAHSVVLNREIDIQLAEKILKFSVKTEKEPITIDHILKVVCNYFDVEMDDIQCITKTAFRTSTPSRHVLSLQIHQPLLRTYRYFDRQSQPCHRTPFVQDCRRQHTCRQVL